MYSIRPLLEPGMETFIRTEVEVGIVRKVTAIEHSFVADFMESGRYFGYHTQVLWNGEDGTLQTADGKSSFHIKKVKTGQFSVKVYIAHGYCWIRKNNVRNPAAISAYKVLVPNAGNPGSTILGRMKIAEPGSCSSNTYNLYIASSKREAENVLEYFSSKFVRFLVAIMTTTQHTPPKVFGFVPMQDFSKPWTDAELYKKYKLTNDEIAFIESMIKPME